MSEIKPVAIVTGASRGIGRGIALELAKTHTVVGTYRGRRDAAESLRDECGADIVQCDIGSAADRAALIEHVRKTHGRLDLLVNNAGIAPPNLAEDVTEEDYDLTMAINLKGTFLASQAAGRLMIGQRGGRIINVSSQAGLVALPTESIYCATKAAIIHLTRCLAVEWGKHGINVNAVAPTFIETPGTDECLSDPAFRADVVERIAALHHIGQPMDVAGAVVFLASPAAALITGHTLVIDGGWTAR